MRCNFHCALCIVIILVTISSSMGYRGFLMVALKKPNLIARCRSGLSSQNYYKQESLKLSLVTKDTTFDTPVEDLSVPRVNPIQYLGTLWKFSRPHTAIGTIVSALSAYLFAIPVSKWLSFDFVVGFIMAIIPSLLMNVYITGLNQLTDVDIDKINKPYLPLASGELSYRDGRNTVIACLTLSLLLSRNAPWPLQWMILTSGVLGSLYSLEPFRLKKYPLLAAVSILVVRGALVNLGFFFSAKSFVLREHVTSLFGGLQRYPEIILPAIFFAAYGSVIALMKDVPDISGDKANNISSFSVCLGARNMFRISWKLLRMLLAVSSCIAFQFSFVSGIAGNVIKAISRLVASYLLLQFSWSAKYLAKEVDAENPDEVYSYYMFIWKLFYLCYGILPLLK